MLAMLAAGPRPSSSRARGSSLRASAPGAEVVAAVARVGGGALPLLELPGPAVALPGHDPAGAGRGTAPGEPPVVARIEDGRLLLDPRTLAAGELAAVVAAARAALESSGASRGRR